MDNDGVTTTAEETGLGDSPLFDPDPDLVADLEGNPFALRSFRKAAQKAHDAAERQRSHEPSLERH